MSGYGTTFKRLSDWTFDRKSILNENLHKDRLRRDLESAIEENRNQWKLQQQADGERQRVRFDRKLDYLESFQERIENEGSRYEAELFAKEKATERVQQQAVAASGRRTNPAARGLGRASDRGSSGGGSGE
eukprot:CAMPEP_0114150562 /NCGR_PEP_ID=MMETSP0043_2-20121206/22777_1 /TAXON_ID=464988 /ORGANISM="Hemiselmis andersenii, Strain CCMP644" /LENGTH=130 /DNA_ID=CAMNT_0001245317 /DNA_START=152 /DNA_END=541 /DNA_ORIENTATION=-